MWILIWLFFILYFSIIISGDDIYRFDGISRDGWYKLASCGQTEKCDRYGIYGYTLDGYTLIDNKRKILMEFTPKADCTSAVVAFFKAVGFEYGIDYKGWPHTFRDKYFNARCGRATACMYYQDDWYRFKVVRNPYDRVVSSYVYVMKTNFLTKFIPYQLRNASFEQFIDLLSSLRSDDLQEYAYRHASLQSQPYERYLYQQNISIFHEIVQVENITHSLQRIYQKTGILYDFNFIPKHYQKRVILNKYVGNLTWTELQHQVPKNYGLFYNSITREKVAKIFHWDLLLYNYSYPFDV